MYILIVNPEAGNGRSLKVLKKLQKDPLFKQKDCRSFFTKYEGHAEELVKHVLEIYNEKVKCIIAVGGDGTMHEVVNGLKNIPSVPIAYIPAGSGNDFARGTNSKKKPVKLFQDIVQRSYAKPYWCGSYLTDKRKPSNRRVFASNIGFGFDAEIAQRANRSTYKKWLNKLGLGSLAYAIALVQTIFQFEPKEVELTIDGERRTLSNVWMITTGVHGYYGGGMKVIPSAKMTKDSFHVLIIENISKWKVLAVFLSVFWGGHIKYNEVTVLKASSLSINGNKSISYHVDGQTGKCQKCVIEKESFSRKIFQF
ncbi:diacylglycerol kinase family protein [Pontibacillus sp. HMF3514]|uniref:diacylglycerol/lipid kinase family protein n=1 Tax=Pontibacillus sp. HMF3514 TaxID=2692425 RepID=UPI00131F5FE9|nr:diacylglycerol kinase family protein [Pontibacillus sp. HMF3514]QHE53307.1 YegS/Rv2252/BmrU family lipid kinase [Pontibacillus sp. HMF3514]